MLARVLPSRDIRRMTVVEDDDFVNEVHILSRLDHVNIVRLIGYVVSSRPWLIVSQLSTGVTCLREHLLRASASDVTARSTLLQICRQMTSAVAYLAAHRWGDI